MKTLGTLMTRSSFVDHPTPQVVAVYALATDIDCKLTVRIRHTRPVAHEPTLLHICPHRVDGRYGMARRQARFIQSPRLLVRAVSEGPQCRVP